MIKMIKKNSALAVLFALSSSVLAADPLDIKIKGTIMPTGCTPTLSNGGVIDYGDIPFASLSETKYTKLSVKDISLTVNCGAATKFAIEAKNGRPGTTAGTGEFGQNSVGAAPILMHNSNTQNRVVGLGFGPKKTKIGGYSILMKNVVADGKVTSTLYSLDNGGTWTFNASGAANLYSFNSPNIVGAGLTTTSREIGAYKVVNATISVDAYINKTSELDLSRSVKLDGLTTLEVIYL